MRRSAFVPSLIVLAASGLPWLAHAQTPPAAVPSLQPPVATSPPPVAPANPAERREWLKARLDDLFAKGPLAAAKVSVLVAESDTGKPVYARGEKVGLNAASNVKLVTSAAALSLLGPAYRFKTSLYAPARNNGRWLAPGGELTGDIYIKGTGDPTLTAHDLTELAGELAATGVRKIHGAVVVDATAFDSQTVGPGFEQKTETAAFRAPSSAASLNFNAVAVTIIPASTPGAAARIVVEPSSPYLVVQGRITTAKEGPAVPSVETSEGSNNTTQVILGGRVRLGAEPRTLYRRIVHPERFLGETFRQITQRRGITFDRPVRLEAVPSETYRLLATHDSPPLAVVVQELNKRSSNFAAEQILRALGAEVGGRPGTWSKGLEAVAKYLAGIGIPRASYQMTNGSGLYDSNRFSAEQLVTVIRAAMRDFRIASEFEASLAVAGSDGTLAQRMGQTLAERYVRAKTGTLATTSCLSGIAGSAGNKPLIFSILVNDVANPLDARLAQDRAAELLVAYLEADAQRQVVGH